MKNRDPIILAVAAVFFLLVPQWVFADVILPLTLYTLPIIPGIIAIEAVLFWLLAAKWLKVQARFLKVLLAVVAANLLSSMVGMLIPIYKFVLQNVAWLAIAFVLSVFLEWGVYILFFRKGLIRIVDLLKISCAVNAATYGILIAFQFVQL